MTPTGHLLVLFGLGQAASKCMDKERNNYHEKCEKRVLTILNALNERVLTTKYKNLLCSNENNEILTREWIKNSKEQTKNPRNIQCI